MSRIYLVIIACVVIAGCGYGKGVLEREKDVYKALISHMGGNESKLLIIRSMSVQENRVAPKPEAQEAQVSEEYQGYLEMNKERSMLPIDLSLDSRLIFLTEDDMDEIFKHSRLKLSWKSFFRKYPDAKGMIGLSRVGFNSSLTKAMVYIEFTCGPLCGNGYVATLERGLLGWEVKAMEHLWVS